MNKHFKHSGDLGDLIYSLPVIKYMGGAKVVFLNPEGLKRPKCDGTASGFIFVSINFLKSLLESQLYISSVQNWTDEHIHVDLDSFRGAGYLHSRNLCEVILNHFKTPSFLTNKPWIHVNPKTIAEEVFNRTPRYQNCNVDLKPYLEKAKNPIFIGLHSEWMEFCGVVGKIPFYKVEDAYEMAQIIKGSKLFVGNQSFGMSLAIAMHVPFVQEVCPHCQNCIFQRQGAIYLTENSK